MVHHLKQVPPWRGAAQQLHGAPRLGGLAGIVQEVVQQRLQQVWFPVEGTGLHRKPELQAALVHEIVGAGRHRPGQRLRLDRHQLRLGPLQGK